MNPSRAISYFKKWLILKDIEWFKEESDLMFKISLDSLEFDITLWKNEKKGLKDYITNLNKDEQK